TVVARWTARFEADEQQTFRISHVPTNNKPCLSTSRPGGPAHSACTILNVRNLLQACQLRTTAAKLLDTTNPHPPRSARFNVVLAALAAFDLRCCYWIYRESRGRNSTNGVRPALWCRSDLVRPAPVQRGQSRAGVVGLRYVELGVEHDGLPIVVT